MWKAEITWSGTEGESVSVTWKVLVEDGSQTRLTRTRTVALNGALGSTFSIPPERRGLSLTYPFEPL